jgi:hypothetical protein
MVNGAKNQGRSKKGGFTGNPNLTVAPRATNTEGPKEKGNMATQPPDDLSPFIQLAQDLREASATRDYTNVGRLVTENLQPDQVDIIVYIRTPLGHLTIVGSYIQQWSPMAPDRLNYEPSLNDMAVILRAAARR